MTLKRILILLMSIPFYVCTYCQAGTHSVSFAGGAAIPQPKFAEDWTRGKTGYVADVSYQYQFKESNLVVVFNVRYRRNVLEPIFYSSYSGGKYTKTNGSVSMPALLIGPGYYYLLSNRWFAEAQLLAGTTKITVNSVHEKYVASAPQPSGFDGVYRFDIGKGSRSAFTSLLRLGPGFRLSKTFDLFINVEYWYTKSDPIETTALIQQYVSHEDPARLTKNPSTLDILGGLRLNF